MKIVARATFLAMPANTVFSKFQPYCFDEVQIKGDTVAGIDFYCQGISDSQWAENTGDFIDQCDAAMADGKSIRLEFDTECRDGLFDEGQMFAVWEPDDVRALIARLQSTLKEGA